jgi:hypothetical protein
MKERFDCPLVKRRRVPRRYCFCHMAILSHVTLLYPVVCANTVDPMDLLHAILSLSMHGDYLR